MIKKAMIPPQNSLQHFDTPLERSSHCSPPLDCQFTELVGSSHSSPSTSHNMATPLDNSSLHSPRDRQIPQQIPSHTSLPEAQTQSKTQHRIFDGPSSQKHQRITHDGTKVLASSSGESKNKAIKAFGNIEQQRQQDSIKILKSWPRGYWPRSAMGTLSLTALYRI